ncbi:DNA polymerase III subunit chi [Thiococcus pfennigii]|uniref:DNA polymerase III subunit chi n=1 Tax=Thiococcus pfennigii TaxID=1057 RepID=UPI001905DB49|nr:DNA polymerase III subunit chi [Thiococcus pfennigii]MBK1731230.1 DNA polymerase III subunit chi [Thiococcus pfennigii]
MTEAVAPPRVSFYSLADDAAGDRFQLVCRLVERIYATGLRIYILAASDQDARHVDRLLWTYREQSFLPHGLKGETDAELTPILIGRDPDPGDARSVLINLAARVPEHLERFERLCEAVDHDPAVREAARERYRHYRRAGLAVEHYEIRLA